MAPLDSASLRSWSFAGDEPNLAAGWKERGNCTNAPRAPSTASARPSPPVGPLPAVGLRDEAPAHLGAFASGFGRTEGAEGIPLRRQLRSIQRHIMRVELVAFTAPRPAGTSANIAHWRCEKGEKNAQTFFVRPHTVCALPLIGLPPPPCPVVWKIAPKECRDIYC